MELASKYLQGVLCFTVLGVLFTCKYPECFSRSHHSKQEMQLWEQTEKLGNTNGCTETLFISSARQNSSRLFTLLGLQYSCQVKTVLNGEYILSLEYQLLKIPNCQPTSTEVAIKMLIVILLVSDTTQSQINFHLFLFCRFRHSLTVYL